MELQMIVMWDTDTFSIYKNKKSVCVGFAKAIKSTKYFVRRKSCEFYHQVKIIIMMK